MPDLRAQHQEQAGEGEKQAGALEREAEKLRREIDRLVGALAITDDKPDAIVRSIAERQARLRDLEAKVSAAKAAPQVVEDALTQMTAAAMAALQRFRETMAANPDQAREVVTALFDKIVFTPVSTPAGPRYELEGVAKIGRLLALDSDAKGASPAGVEHIPPDRDFFDGSAVLPLRNVASDATIADVSRPNNPESPEGAMSCVYVVEAKDLDMAKIGTTTNFEDRLAALRTTCPAELQVVRVFDGDVELERRLHKCFAPHRVRGEWFRL
jgi:hypothetical protein